MLDSSLLGTSWFRVFGLLVSGSASEMLTETLMMGIKGIHSKWSGHQKPR